MTTATRRRPTVLCLTGYLLAFAAAGCSTAPLLQRQSFDFKTTALFQKPCPVPESEPRGPEHEAAMPAKVAKVSLIQDARSTNLETKENRCNATYLEKMVEKFLEIRETDEAQGVLGDTIDDVRQKGFSIHVGGDTRVQRPNTRTLYGADALAAVGMGVSAPPLQKVEEIKSYTDFMSQHYGEEYYEKDMKKVVDRFCLNRRDMLDIGDDRTFTIVWRGGRVLKRVIKGGPIDNPKQDRGFLICPGDFIVDTVGGTASSAIKALAPVP
jgi:hypothetical protein